MQAAYIKPYDKAYGPTYTVLDILQKVFYTSNAAREAWEMVDNTSMLVRPSSCKR